MEKHREPSQPMRAKDCWASTNKSGEHCLVPGCAGSVFLTPDPIVSQFLPPRLGTEANIIQNMPGL